jgi:hypothetical protein
MCSLPAYGTVEVRVGFADIFIAAFFDELGERSAATARRHGGGSRQSNVAFSTQRRKGVDCLLSVFDNTSIQKYSMEIPAQFDA